ncbi:MAG: hypothetical protein ABFD98_11985 [Syntrophobacteraceae bacterium]|nr:hypothetical protein [Desulfobacteraceae bacterium]
MSVQKDEILEKIQAKGLNVPQVAEAIQFDPTLLGLYLAGDSYPVPTRILKKLSEALAN